MARGAEAKDPRKAKYHEHHPMRVEGIMPHDMEGDGFIEYQILQAMTEDGYWLSVLAGEEVAEDYAAHGIPISTANLTDDQKGWAKADHYDHYLKETARWRVVKGKESKVVPAKLAYQIRDLLYRDHCSCEEPKLVQWGYRWDLRPLHQCHNCGEVIIKPPRIYHTQTIEDKDDTNDDDATTLDQPDQAA